MLICGDWNDLPGGVKRKCSQCGREVVMDARNEVLERDMEIICSECGGKLMEEDGAIIAGIMAAGEVRMNPGIMEFSVAEEKANEVFERLEKLQGSEGRTGVLVARFTGLDLDVFASVINRILVRHGLKEPNEQIAIALATAFLTGAILAADKGKAVFN
jgi:DNA-directed RNA polymerase subunit RPC12/RpoP